MTSPLNYLYFFGLPLAGEVFRFSANASTLGDNSDALPRRRNRFAPFKPQTTLAHYRLSPRSIIRACNTLRFCFFWSPPHRILQRASKKMHKYLLENRWMLSCKQLTSHVNRKCEVMQPYDYVALHIYNHRGCSQILKCRILLRCLDVFIRKRWNINSNLGQRYNVDIRSFLWDVPKMDACNHTKIYFLLVSSDQK